MPSRVPGLVVGHPRPSHRTGYARDGPRPAPPRTCSPRSAPPWRPSSPSARPVARQPWGGPRESIAGPSGHCHGRTRWTSTSCARRPTRATGRRLGEEQFGVVLLDEELVSRLVLQRLPLGERLPIDARGRRAAGWDPDGYHWAPGCSLAGSCRGGLLPGRGGSAQDRRRAAATWPSTPGGRPVEARSPRPPRRGSCRTAAGGPRISLRRGPAVHAEAQLRDDVLLILSAEGEAQEEHSLYALLSGNPEVLELKEVKASGAHGPSRSSCSTPTPSSTCATPTSRRDLLYAVGNVLVSMRHEDAVAIVDLDTSRAVWSWGHGKVLGPSATVLASGNVLIFDNGLGAAGRGRRGGPRQRTGRLALPRPRRRDFYGLGGSNQRLATATPCSPTRTTGTPSRSRRGSACGSSGPLTDAEGWAHPRPDGPTTSRSWSASSPRSATTEASGAACGRETAPLTCAGCSPSSSRRELVDELVL